MSRPVDEKEIQDLVREERRRYAKEWRAKNPDKVRASNQRYWLRKAQARLNLENGQKMRVD